MKVQQRKRQQEKRAAAAAKEVKLLAQKQKLIDGLIEQERTKIAQQLVDNAGLKLEELQRQRQALALQRQEFEQQQAREKMLIREDMIQCPITQEVGSHPCLNFSLNRQVFSLQSTFAVLLTVCVVCRAGNGGSCVCS